MEKKFIDFVKDYAKREFACANFDKTELSKSMLNFLEECAKFTNEEPDSMRKFVDIFHLLLNQFPIVPITENDFYEYIEKQEGGPDYKVWRCSRYFPLYRTDDGKYWDDQAIAFKFKNDPNSQVIYLYNNKNCSKQQVTLPYYPGQRVEYIDSIN